MATTTNFGWETPDDTDLVKDGAAAMRTLGNSIDTSFVDLKGGTTGQVLAKASNTDLDFTWAADASGIPATIFDAKGDLIAATAADTAARLAIGTNGQILTADSTASTGMKWAALPASVKNFSLLGTGTLTGAGAATVTVSGISAQDQLFIVIVGASSANASSTISLRLNTDTGANYEIAEMYLSAASTYTPASIIQGSASGAGADRMEIGAMSSNAASGLSGYAVVSGCNSAGYKMVNYATGSNQSGGSNQVGRVGVGFWTGSATVTSVSLVSSTGNFDAGTFRVYGSA